MMENKCIILGRSTTLENGNNQTEVLVDAAKKDGYLSENIITIDYKDTPGLNEEERKGINVLKEQIEADQLIGCVYCYEPSRLGRNPKANEEIRCFLQEHHVQLVFLNPMLKVFNEDFTISETASVMFGMKL